MEGQGWRVEGQGLVAQRSGDERWWHTFLGVRIEVVGLAIRGRGLLPAGEQAAGSGSGTIVGRSGTAEGPPLANVAGQVARHHRSLHLGQHL